ncbi:MAG: ribonuclease R [Lachnospiraceae bacterium]|nr:ribonuclease R [Lachnospiraceae bacterium]
MKKNREQRKKTILALMKDKHYVPMKEKELAVVMQVASEDRPELSSLLQELMLEGSIEINKRGRYSIIEKASGDKKTKGKDSSDKRHAEGKKADEEDLITGTFISNQNGYGFVEVDGRDEDIFIPEKHTGGAFHLDTVRVRLVKDKRPAVSYGKAARAKMKAQGVDLSAATHRVTGRVVDIVERGTTQIVGVFDKSNKSFGFVVPDNTKLSSDIYVRTQDSLGAVSGHKVVVELISYGDDRHSPEGRVTEILGHKNDPGVDILSIVKGYGIPSEYPDDVMRQTAKVPEEVPDEDMEGRTDLRDVIMVTIDGEDAKDLDDAVSLTMEGDNFVLGVHIADVSNYVREGTPLDKEALTRGTSVYLVDRVIPMLPHKLSNGICSLNEGVDRLAMSCIMTIAPDGTVIDHKICESVIKVNHRLNYNSVNKMIYLKDEEERAKYPDVTDMLDSMYRLSLIVRKRREKRGSIDFDLTETKIILDENGHPTDIHPYERNAATMLIEDFMLMANETVAEHFYSLDIPFVYRTHEAPDPEKMDKLATFVNNHGHHLRIGKDEIRPKEVQRLLSDVTGTPAEALISRMALRSMKQAKYTIDCSGHFGLACKYYCHFTSPIRRYPDLQIHRIIKEQLHGRMDGKRIEHYNGILALVSDKSSRTERRAEEAERETIKLKKAEYMQEHIGEEYDGIISGITEWGIYVELPSTVEGLVHISKLPGDHYVYDEAAYEMRGTGHGRKFLLGQEVRIRVDSVDIFMRNINFDIVE